MKMDIMEIAALLGKTLKEDERLKALEEAKEAYTSDVELQKKLVEYEVQQRALQGEITKEERDTAFIDIIQTRIDQLYREITEAPAFIRLNEVQAEVNELMNAVNATITANITGETPSSCTHNCSSCAGCH
ncbi:MAG: YlbF family regulator [Clostridia bacterium]|nr:YlbF family regulator [Clostridia bacterium]